MMHDRRGWMVCLAILASLTIIALILKVINALSSFYLLNVRLPAPLVMHGRDPRSVWVCFHQHKSELRDNQTFAPCEYFVLVVDVFESMWCHTLMWLHGENVKISVFVMVEVWAHCSHVV
jgi:hypothetical protein